MEEGSQVGSQIPLAVRSTFDQFLLDVESVLIPEHPAKFIHLRIYR